MPTFPDLTLAGAYGCITNCTAVQQAVTVSLTSFTSTAICDKWTLAVRVTSGGNTVMSGTFLLHYERTYIYHRTAMPADDAQVWRFGVNGDLVYQQTSLPCGIPPCQTTFGTVHFIGTLDYECHNELDQKQQPIPVWSARLDATHFMDGIHHALFSSRFGAFHPCVLYALVTPGSFTFSPATIPAAPGGFFPQETLREDQFASPTICCFDHSGYSATHTNGIARCLAPGSCGNPANRRWTDQTVSGLAVCSGTLPFTSTPTIPPLTTGYGTNYLGQYTAPVACYPGPTDLWVDFGVVTYGFPTGQGLCASLYGFGPMPPMPGNGHIVGGSTTRFNGTTVDIVGGATGLTIMKDVTNFMRLNAPSPPLVPVWGVPAFPNFTVMTSR